MKQTIKSLEETLEKFHSNLKLVQDLATFKTEFTLYVNNNQTNAIIIEDSDEQQWSQYYEMFRSGMSYKDILDYLFETVYPEGL